MDRTGNQAARTRPGPRDLGSPRPAPPRPANEDRPDAEHGVPDGDRPEAAHPYDLIELLFFAYRDFVSDPDRILAEYGFGRAHHRVLHFVARNPGLTIAELLDILRITKQSLNRVLKELIETGYIAQRAGTSDRRHRLLTCTPEGRRLAAELARVQGERVRRALAEAGPGSRLPASRLLLAMIDPDNRAAVGRLVGAQDAPRATDAHRPGEAHRATEAHRASEAHSATEAHRASGEA